MSNQYTDPYDVAVVGAGVAGIIVAAKIAQFGVHPATGGRLRIALLERGPYLRGAPRPGYGHPLRRRMFTNVTSEFGSGGRYRMAIYPDGPGGPNTFPISAGSLVGGGSFAYRAQTRDPHPVDYLAWERETGVDWTRDRLRSAAREVVQRFNIHERPDVLLPRFDLEFREAGRKLGLEVSPTSVSKTNCISCGFCDGVDMCKYDARGGSFFAYLPEAEAHGVEVIPDSEVQRVVLEGETATGVTFTQQNREYLLKADKVILSCGIFGTPYLLMRSGYGPRRELGRDLLVANENVGRHVDGRVGPVDVEGLFEGPMSDGRFHDGGFHLFQNTDPEGIYERIQLRSYHPSVGQPHQAALHALAPEFGRQHKEFMRQICNPAVPSGGRDQLLSRGKVTVVIVRSTQVLGRVNRRSELLYSVDHPALEKLFSRGVDLAREVLYSMKAREVRVSRRPIPRGGFLAWAGSCRAGSDPRNSVVDSFGGAHEVENLFICDSSVIPRCTSQGYAAPTATVAAFLADRLVRRHFQTGRG